MKLTFKYIAAAFAVASVFFLSSHASAQIIATFTGDIVQPAGEGDPLGLNGGAFVLDFTFAEDAVFSPEPGVLGGIGFVSVQADAISLTVTDSTGAAITTNNPGIVTTAPEFQFTTAGANAGSAFFTDQNNSFGFEIVAGTATFDFTFDDEFFITPTFTPVDGTLISLGLFNDGTLVPLAAGQTVGDVDGPANQFSVSNVQFSAAVVSQVPEPSSLALLGFGGLLALGRRRKA